MKRFSTWALAAILGVAGLVFATGNFSISAQDQGKKACCTECCCCKADAEMCKHKT